MSIGEEKVAAALGNTPIDDDDQRDSITPVLTDPSALNSERIALQIHGLTLSGFLSQERSVANFRNIQYGQITGRWHEAKLLNPEQQHGIVDATQWGPRCPQGLNVLHRNTSHLYPRMSLFDRQSEFECLNLNIYGPHDAVGCQDRGRLLPVLVWIHGGSFDFGDGGCEAGMTMKPNMDPSLTGDLIVRWPIPGEALHRSGSTDLSCGH